MKNREVKELFFFIVLYFFQGFGILRVSFVYFFSKILMIRIILIDYFSIVNYINKRNLKF